MPNEPMSEIPKYNPAVPEDSKYGHLVNYSPEEPTQPADEFGDRDKYERGRERFPRYEVPPLYKLASWVEDENVPEVGEVVKVYRKAAIDMLGPLFDLQFNARARFDMQDYSVARINEIQASVNRSFDTATVMFEDLEEIKKPEAKTLATIMNRDIVRVDSFYTLEKHSIGFKRFYYDKKGTFSLLATGARQGTMMSDDMRLMFGHLKGLDLPDQKVEELGIKKEQLVGDETSKMVRQMDHFERAIAAMNRFNAEKKSGEEMFMVVPEVEQEFLASFFTIEGESDEGSPSDSDFEPKRTQKITVSVPNENGNQVDKTFWTNLLSYYVTVDPETDRKKYEATMKALMEVDALDKLKELPRVWVNLQNSADQKAKYEELVKQVRDARDRRLGKWDMRPKPPRARIADWAYEHGFTLQVATQNISELAYRWKWKKGGGVWNMSVEIPGPETGHDAVNGKNGLVHETLYKVEKGRVMTKVMPWPNPETSGEMIKIMLMETRGKDPKPIILNNHKLSLGAAVIGLYPGEAGINLNEEERKRLKLIHDNVPVNQDALRILDAMLWMWDLSAENCYLPMPIKPTLDSFNLLKVMKDKTTEETAYETLHKKEYATMEDVDFENMTWYAPDAWEVNMKMLEDVLGVAYGGVATNDLVKVFENDGMTMGEFIKKLDIGGRAEKWELMVRKSIDPSNSGYKEYEKITVPKGFIEIMHTAYLLVTYTALVKHGIWDKGGWGEHNQKNYWESIQSLLTMAMYEPENKGGFKNYSGTLARVIEGVAEWYAASAPSFNNEAAGLKDLIDHVTPKKEKYTEPNSKFNI